MASRTRRPGRPPESERAARREAALDAALDELCAKGYDGMTMAGVARRAGSSKESLYTWFGSRNDMLAEVIRRNAEATNSRVVEALDATGTSADREAAHAALVAIATALLGLLSGPVAVALNRAATTSPELAAVLLAHGRHATGPIVERYLARLNAVGVLSIDDPATAFPLFYGLTVQDTQIRVLLGEPPPEPAEVERRARLAVDRFLLLSDARSAG